MESWSLNPTERNWGYCCTSSTKSSCEISSDSSSKNEECLTNTKPHDSEQSCNGFCYFGSQKNCPDNPGAKFQYRQCYHPDSNHEYYQCLNRKDIDEDVLRTKPIFDSEKQVSSRKNYFQLFPNSSITNSSITCGNEIVGINCLDTSSKTKNCENVTYSDYELCRATDFALHNGWINDEESKSESYLERNGIGKTLTGTDN